MLGRPASSWLEKLLWTTVCAIVLGAVHSLRLPTRTRRVLATEPRFLSRDAVPPVSVDKDFIIGYNMDSSSIDNREKLPFVITHMAEKSEIDLGTYLLDPNTACGDTIELGEKGIFKVKKVRFFYKYNGRNYVVFKKKIEAKRVKSYPKMIDPSVTGNILQ